MSHDPTIIAPVAGRVIALADVPDPVFSAELVGSGVAIEPPDGDHATAIAPVAGRLVKLHPHAFVILRDDGVGVLVHMGIDTVKLGGEGFTLLVTEGAELTAGDPVVEFSPHDIRARGLSAVVPVVVMDTPAGAVESPGGADITAGAALFDWPAR